MTSETPKRVRMWSFHQAPPDFQSLFPAANRSDWLAHVPESERAAVEPSFTKWLPVYPVESAELEDRSVVYLGSPASAIRSVVKLGTLSTGLPPAIQERRAAQRVQIECPSRYETPDLTGLGYTIDMSSTGIAFTTEDLLTKGARVTLHIAWPARLEGGGSVECHAVGKLARAEPMKAVLQMESLAFSVK